MVNGDTVVGKSRLRQPQAAGVKHGRRPEHVAILPGVMPIIGETDAQAKEQLDRLQSWLTPTNALALVS